MNDSILCLIAAWQVCDKECCIFYKLNNCEILATEFGKTPIYYKMWVHTYYIKKTTNVSFLLNQINLEILLNKSCLSMTA